MNAKPQVEPPVIQFYRQNPRVYDALYHSRPKDRRALKSSAHGTGQALLSSQSKSMRRLSDLLEPLNIFEPLNAKDYEARHSNFLSWLLAPRESHGLGVTPLESFFKLLCSKRAPQLSARPDAIEVHRERGRMDLFIVDHDARRGLLIENKIHSGEHSRQLQRYRQRAESEFRNYDFDFVYLTPGEVAPSDSSYKALSYRQVAEWLDGLLGALPRNGSFSTGQRLNLLWHHCLDFLNSGTDGAATARPNLFSALSLREIRHSDFWAWLFDPRESHELGEAAIREFLRLLAKSGDKGAAATLQRPLGSFADLVVHRELNDADLILVSSSNNWVGVVEIKIEAQETGDQLAKYGAYVDGQFEGYRRSFAFMTLRGAAASEPQYLPIAFDAWRPFFERLVGGEPRRSAASELTLMLSDYRDLLLDRLNYFDSTITILAPRVRTEAETVWRVHGDAARETLNVVASWQQDTQRQLEDFIVETVTTSFSTGCFRPSRFPGSLACYMPFVPNEWQSIRSISHGGGDRAFTGQLVNLTFLNFPFVNPFQNAENMGVTLVIGLTQPRSGYESLREIIYGEARAMPDLFNTAKKTGGAGSRKNIRLGVHCLVTAEECRRLPVENVKKRFRDEWQRFREHQYPRIKALLQQPSIARFRP